jgi:periplasmic divalent cation tolerance protein
VAIGVRLLLPVDDLLPSGVTSFAVQAILVVTTVGTEEEANLLAQELVERRHSCCVNILPVHRSVYRWQGKICTDSEFMLIIKGLESEYAAIEAAIKELHSYELPEILAFDIKQGEEGFLHWIHACSGGGSVEADEDQEEG